MPAHHALTREPAAAGHQCLHRHDAGDAETVEVLAPADRLLMNSVVLGELLGGFAAGTREANNRVLLAKFLDSPRVELLAVTAVAADSYALGFTSACAAKGSPIHRTTCG